MAPLTQWTWVWASSRRWWRSGKPGMLQSMGWQGQTSLSDWTTMTTISNVKQYWIYSLLFYTNRNNITGVFSKMSFGVCFYRIGPRDKVLKSKDMGSYISCSVSLNHFLEGSMDLHLRQQGPRWSAVWNSAALVFKESLLVYRGK